MLYLWIKALHIVAMVCWFAGLFYPVSYTHLRAHET